MLYKYLKQKYISEWYVFILEEELWDHACSAAARKEGKTSYKTEWKGPMRPRGEKVGRAAYKKEGGVQGFGGYPGMGPRFYPPAFHLPVLTPHYPSQNFPDQIPVREFTND